MIPCQVISTSMGSCYDVIFTPTEATTLSINIQFNGVDISDSPIKCEVFDSCWIEASGSGLSLAQVDQVASFVVTLGKDGHEQDLVINILGKCGSGRYI